MSIEKICNKGILCKRCNNLIPAKYNEEYKTYFLRGVKMSGFDNNDHYLCLDCFEKVVNFLNKGNKI